jgi:hypothetical protein
MDDTCMTGSPGVLRASTAAANDAMHKLLQQKADRYPPSRISVEQEPQATYEMD